MRTKTFIAFVLMLVGFSACKREKIPEEGNVEEMLQEVNVLRRSGCRCGTDSMPPVPELSWNQYLETAARLHAEDMYNRNYFDHISPEGTSPIQRAQAAGYTGQYVGEDIGRGYTTIQQVVSAWKASESHCKAMMDSIYRNMGAARYGEYWVLELGKPN